MLFDASGVRQRRTQIPRGAMRRHTISHLVYQEQKQHLVQRCLRSSHEEPPAKRNWIASNDIGRASDNPEPKRRNSELNTKITVI